MKFNNIYFEPYKDIFNYHTEIQKLNHGYRLYFNKKEKQFCIVNIFNNFEICLTFKSIFNFCLNNLRFCSIQNFQNIFNFIEDFNNNLKEKENNNNRELLKFYSKELLNLSKHSSCIKQKDINKIIGATIC